MKNDIKTKLKRIFGKECFEESDVVYILSRIRKILEIDNKEKKYGKLKFYCDWALHKQIDNTNSVSEDLKNFPEDTLASHKFLNYEVFNKELKAFLKEYKIETNIYENLKNKLRFQQKLTEIYSDTPLIIKEVKKITIKSGELKEANIAGKKIYIPAVEFIVTNEE